MDKGEVRFDSICKMKTSSHTEFIKDKISIECSDKAINIYDQLSVTGSIVSTEVARVHADLEVVLVLQEMKLYLILFVWLLTGVCYFLDSVRLKLGVDNYLLKEGLRTKLDIS